MEWLQFADTAGMTAVAFYLLVRFDKTLREQTRAIWALTFELNSRKKPALQS